MRGPFIWAPINIGDWNTATQGLSLDAQAVVIKLLFLFWEDGEFPEDRSIPRLMGISPRRWLDLQELVGIALNKFLDRSSFVGERLRAAKTSEERRRAVNNRWDKYRRNATQGLDTNAYANAYTNVIPSTSTPTEGSKKDPDRAAKPAEKKGLGEREVGLDRAVPYRPNGKLRH